MSDDRWRYRQIIDELVDECRAGQGQIGAHRARAGVWNSNAGPAAEGLEDQARMNDVLYRLGPADREVLAVMLAEAFVDGVHTALVTLHEHEVPPFEDGYEGTPFHDFVGRLDGWEWPEDLTPR
jgi:hypothetical protein